MISNFPPKLKRLFFNHWPSNDDVTNSKSFFNKKQVVINPKKLCKKFASNLWLLTDCSNFDKWCSDAHFLPFLFYNYCTCNEFIRFLSKNWFTNFIHKFFSVWDVEKDILIGPKQVFSFSSSVEKEIILNICK